MLAQKIDNVISEFEDSLKKEKNNRFYDSEEEHQKLIKDYEMHLNIMYLIRSSFVNYCKSEDHINEFNVEEPIEIQITKISEEAEMQILNKMAKQRQNNIDSIEYTKKAKPQDRDILNEELEKNIFELSVINEFLSNNK